MKKLLSVLIIAFFWLGSTAQTFTNVNNYQNVSGFELVKYFGIPYGATPTHNGVIPVINGVTGRPPGALFYNTTDSSLYGYTGSQWLKIAGGGSGPGGKDTVLVKDDLTVTFDSTGHQVLGRLRNNGIVSGGIVTRAACLSLDVTTVVISLNGMTYLGSGRTLTVTPADGSFPRTDEVIADTTGNVFIRDGTPSSTPVPSPINPSKEVVLTTYTIAAGASCIGIMSETVYDENTEWTTSHGGTMTVNFNNTANPYHLTKAAFVSVYNDGSSLIFTRTGNDTAQANEILKLFVYLNNRFSNQFQISIFNGSTQVGNTVTFNSGFGLNPFDTLIYQNVSIPFSAFNITNQVFNKIVITFAGNDLSGASGLYIDYIQLQTGVSNFSDGHGVFNFALNATGDSAILTRDDGTVFKIKLGTSGTGSTNTSIGSGFRVAVNGTNNIKSLFCIGCTLDSTTNTNAVTITATTGTVTNIITSYGLSGGPITATGTIKVDTSLLLTKLLAASLYQPLGNYITVLTGDGTASGPGSSLFTLARQLAPTAVKTANYNAVINDLVPCDNTGGSFTVTLPNAPADKSVILVKTVIQSGANTVSLAASGGDVFNKTGGSISLSIANLNEAFWLQYKSSTGIWYVLAHEVPLAAVGTTSYQYQTASGSTNYTFTNVPASMNDYMISVNGSRLRQTTDYTTIGNVITIPSVVSGDQIIFQRIK